MAGAIAGNISHEATTPSGNIFAEAMRGALTERAQCLILFAQQFHITRLCLKYLGKSLEQRKVRRVFPSAERVQILAPLG